MKALKTIGKVTLALVGCALMPVLIWVGLYSAIKHAVKTSRVQTSLAFE